MNCKQGELAMLIKSICGNEGKIVRCIRFERGVLSTRDGTDRYLMDGWIVDPPLPGLNGRKAFCIRDEFLRPIRDPGEGATDETLTWLPVPHKEHA